MATKKTPEEETDLLTLKEQIATMLAEARADREAAAKMLAEAKATTGNSTGMTPEELAAHKAYMDEMVEVKLFKDNGKYKEPVFVGVNGETIALERGVRVKIKRKFAEVLDNSDKQDYETSLLIEQKSGEFAKTGL